MSGAFSKPPPSVEGDHDRIALYCIVNNDMLNGEFDLKTEGMTSMWQTLVFIAGLMVWSLIVWRIVYSLFRIAVLWPKACEVVNYCAEAMRPLLEILKKRISIDAPK